MESEFQLEFAALVFQSHSEIMLKMIPFAKTNGPQLGMSAREITLLLFTVFLCKYTKVLWLCKSKGFHKFLMTV